MVTIKNISIEVVENGASVCWTEYDSNPKKPYDDRCMYKEQNFVKGEGEYGLSKMPEFIMAKVNQAIGQKSMNIKNNENEETEEENEIPKATY